MAKSHIDQVTDALRVAATGDVDGLSDIFTEDVVGWSPELFVTSLGQLKEAFSDREEAFSDIELDISAIEVPDGRVIVEWQLSAAHTGPLTIDDDFTIEPTGRSVKLAGATFTEFEGDKISSFRTYFDDAALLEQMLAPT